MPIIFENRLGNSESDRKLRKIYRLHNSLWTLYYSIFFAALGFFVALSVGVNSNPIIGVIIAIATVGLLVLFVKRQTRRKEAQIALNILENTARLSTIIRRMFPL